MSDLALGKLQAALASATNEVTVAAANLNFDFTLVKIEAPPEYQPLKSILSSGRKVEAESGPAHVTARRLGALFDGVCPYTPELIKAYGNRVSEISKETSAKCPQQPNWIFSEYTGVDATSIWAAATSSKAAIHVHLLACMLARIWNQAEAISVWVEIIKERRREIAASFESGDPVSFSSTAAATQQEITRDQLACWDANARAWLQTADTVKERQLKQLLLIINNISASVNDESTLYQSVIKAWISALDTMEKLVCGAPHAVQNGTILIALSAWHLYPDIAVFGALRTSKEIPMGDSLVKEGGTLSLGLSSGIRQSDGGVYWSLPLRHYRFYGAPVPKTRTLQLDGTRILFPELLQANIGVMLSQWSVSLDREGIAVAMKTLLALACVLPKIKVPSDSLWDKNKWTDMITQPVMSYFEDKERGSLLISLGSRRPDFHRGLTGEADPAFFGLTDLPTLLELIRDADGRVELLRRLGRSLQVPQNSEMILVYYDYENNKDHGIARDESLYATVYGSPEGNEAQGNTKNHRRWVPDKERYRQIPNETIQSLPSRPFLYDGIHITLPKERKVFDFLYGKPNFAAVYLERRGTPMIPSGHDNNVQSEDLLWCFQSHLIHPDRLKKYFENKDIEKKDPPSLRALHYLSVVSIVYSTRSMKEASITSRVLENPFLPSKEMRSWIEAKSNSKSNLSRHLALSIISYLECGQDLLSSLGQNEFQHVIGLSAGDSIYVPKELFLDPIDTALAHEFARLLGNVGKPGVVLLRSAADLMVREINTGAWTVANFSKFDGKAEDSFGQTTLHLSLTDWRLPLVTSQSYGRIDVEAYIMEAYVSVRDAGTWIADIDILAALHNHAVILTRITETNRRCNHPAGMHPSSIISSLETWDEVLDCPQKGSLVTKSHKNWLARLAILSVLAQHRRFNSMKILRIAICPEDICWQCLKPHADTIYIF